MYWSVSPLIEGLCLCRGSITDEIRTKRLFLRLSSKLSLSTNDLFIAAVQCHRVQAAEAVLCRGRTVASMLDDRNAIH